MASDSSQASSQERVSPDGPRSPTSPSSSTPPSRHGHQHRPSQPSHLRQIHMPPDSPEEQRSEPHFDAQDHALDDAEVDPAQQEGTSNEPSEEPDARTRLLEHYGVSNKHGANSSNHGTFSTRPRHGFGYGSFSSYAGTDAGSFEETMHRPSLGGRQPTGINTSREGLIDQYLPANVADAIFHRPKKRSTTHWLASQAGIKNDRMMYVSESEAKCQRFPANMTSGCFVHRSFR